MSAVTHGISAHRNCTFRQIPTGVGPKATDGPSTTASRRVSSSSATPSRTTVGDSKSVSLAATVGAASAQPQGLRFVSGIVEQGGSPDYADTGLGGFHIREGVNITFDRFDLVDEEGDASLVLTPSTANGYVARIVLRDCRLSYSIHIDANDAGGVAQSMGGTNEPLYLTGLGHWGAGL